MSDKADQALADWVTALIPMIAWLMAKEPEDYTYAVRNSDDCWYPPTCKIMTELVPRLTTKDQEYDKATAIADADAAVNSIFTNFKDDALPVIYYPQCIANGYNSTTMQLLADNAYAKTVNEAAKLRLDNINRYAGIRVNDLQVLSQLVGAIRNSLAVGDIYRGTAESFSWVNGMFNVIAAAAEQVTFFEGV
ncbi:MAG: hypothetical protein ACRCUS_01590 [Anaerovoracaceae bacterium]